MAACIDLSYPSPSSSSTTQGATAAAAAAAASSLSRIIRSHCVKSMEAGHTADQTAGGVPPVGGQEGHTIKPLDISAERQRAQEVSNQDPYKSANDAKKDTEKQQVEQEDQPPGGITIHRATNLPMADINSLSSDPYVLAECKTDNPMRHKEDPPLRYRTPTIRRNTDPEWNADWIVANAPAQGFKLKLRVYDEDPANKDDRLGNVHVHVPPLDGWEGLHDKKYHIEKKSGSKRAYLVRAVATCFRVAEHMHGDLFISMQVLEKTPEDGQNGRMYTIGPQWWTRHYSPLLGRIAHTHNPAEDDSPPNGEEVQTNENGEQSEKEERRKARPYDFQANQLQLRGPVPPELYHRYVEFKPWTKRMFTNSGVRGMVLSKALHHQHARVYSFDKSTVYGSFGKDPGMDVTKHFLELVHYDQGARIFTYVLTLDALFRFTETGKEFGIDMLSKHTMHSDVSMYIAYSGEFFIRRLKHPRRPPPPEPTEHTTQSHPPPHAGNTTHPPEDIDGGPPKEDPPNDPSHYELVIDNDSGTYRPNADILPLLKSYLAANLPGLHILTLDCNADKDKMDKLKSAQRERKKKEGDHIIYRQGSRSSSISSSDESDLDELEEDFHNDRNEPHERGAFNQYAKDRKQLEQAKWNKIKRDYGLAARDAGPLASEGTANRAEASAHGHRDAPPPGARIS
ncbi:hypothetical protein Q7P37_002844 [Cladosporium fusiforme]